MKDKILSILDDSIDIKRRAIEVNIDAIVLTVQHIQMAMAKGSKLLLFGNGGSAADSQHIAAEFIGRFQKERRALPAIALTTDTSSLTALANDYGFDTVFSRQVEGIAKTDDILIGISTSGNSPNVIKGIEKGNAMGLFTVALTGGDGGQMAAISDARIIVPSKNTARVQEAHICIGHIICELVEGQF